MTRRSRTGGEPAKSRRRKTSGRKSRIAPKAGHPGSTSTANLKTEVARLSRERDEALEQQAATSEVLQLISSWPDDLQPVFAAILESAVRICDASFGDIYRRQSGALRLRANYNTPPVFAEDRKRSEHIPPHPDGVIAQMLATKEVAHVADFTQHRAYREKRVPSVVAAVELGGIRTFLGVRMLKADELLGTLFLSRQQVRPFTEKQIALVKNFAAQAVIAIENARLLNELRQSLEQQTGTADVLRVVSSSQSLVQLWRPFQAALGARCNSRDHSLGGMVS
jgi:GAF domain-containing protein